MMLQKGLDISREAERLRGDLTLVDGLERTIVETFTSPSSGTVG
jgi:hypothetical protein